MWLDTGIVHVSKHSLPQIASQLELLLLHTHLKDSSGSTSFSGDVPLGLGSRCLARSDPHSCPVHVLLIQANNFHWRRLGVLMATEQWISVQSEFDVLYLSCHKIACFQIVEQLCGEWNRAVIIYMYERYFKTHLFLHLVQTLPGWMLGGWRSIHTFCFGKASLPILQCGWGISLSSGYSFSIRLGKEKTNQTQHSIWGHNVFRVGWQWSSVVLSKQRWCDSSACQSLPKFLLLPSFHLPFSFSISSITLVKFGKGSEG